MNHKEIQEITIQEYLDLLKAGTDAEKLEEVNDWLNSKVSVITGGFDLALFQLQKDLLLVQCKHLLAVLEFDEARQERYAKRTEELKAAIKKKTEKKDKSKNDPYESFLEWLLTLKKYYGSDIDRSNDLLYLVAATEQMMKWYSSQPKPENNQKK